MASINAQQNYDKDEEPEEYLGSLPRFGIHETPMGAHVLHLNAGGSLVKKVHIPVLEEIDLEDCNFQSYLDENYLISGTDGAEILAPKLDKPLLEGGNEFLLMIDASGELMWGDLIFYRKGGGTYIRGATFSNGLQTLVPISYEESQKSYSRMEGYIISYDPSGAIKWIKTEGCESV